MSSPLRAQTPKRTFTKKYTTYRPYKPHLKKDFNGRCGYCDSKDLYIGGEKFFHIDHFAPKDKFSELATEYSNLVYACPTCNVAKSNDWPLSTAIPTHDNKVGYVDPCTDEYAQQFNRDKSGRINAQTELGKYISKKLKLYLMKHAYNWYFEILDNKLQMVDDIMKTISDSDPNFIALQKQHYELLIAYREYNKLRMATA